MDLDDAAEAAIKSLLSISPTPQKLTDFRTRLERASERIDSSLRSWRHHLDETKIKASMLNEQHPATITANAWASPETLSAALYRLQAYDEDLIQNRMQALAPVFHHLSLPSNLSHIRSAMARQPIGPETRSWQLISAIVEAGERMHDILNPAESLEKKATKMFEAAMKLRDDLTEQLEASHFALTCVCAETMDALKQMADENPVLDECRSEEIDELYGEGKRSIEKLLGQVEGGINMLHWKMNKLGLKVAGQTMIFEYCGLPHG